MSEDDDPRPPLDGKSFNDPSAWGYCDYCAFEVAVVDGLRQEHRRTRLGNDDTKCVGSGHPPVETVPLEAKPLAQVNFRKDPQRARTRMYWQGRRIRAKAILRDTADREADRQRRLSAFRAEISLEEDCGE